MLLLLLLLRAALSAATLEIEVRHTFNGEPLRLDSLRYENAAGETLSLARVSYLLGGFALERVDGDGGDWVELADQYAWLDVAQGRTTIRLTGVPAGRYRALRFHVGPDAAANAADPAQWPPAHPLNAGLNGLHWSWQGGYIFLAVEGHYRAVPGPGELKGFAYHLARDPSRTRVSLDATLDLARGDGDAGVLLDFELAALLSEPRALSFEHDGAATHSRDGDPVAAALIANLPGAWRVRQVFSAAGPAPALGVPSPVRPLDLPENFTPYRLTVSKALPIPELPRDNPLLEERVALGKRLFHETALSRDGVRACASCHQKAASFSDKRRFSIGVRGQLGARHAMPLWNLAWKKLFFWDGRAASLREQVLMPIQDHAEMDETLERVVAKLSADAAYPPLFAAAFGSPGITAEKVGLALENFLLTLTAFDSKFDRALRGQATFTPEERRGFELFTTEHDPRTGQRGADCFHCHGGALFSDYGFHNNGLVSDDPGRFGVTGLPADRGKFATPPLRDVARRAPYMHDGRFATLEEVVAHYNSGLQRSPTLDPNLAKHPPAGLGLSAEDQAALVAFLKTLNEG